jgi:hypothetical protein
MLLGVAAFNAVFDWVAPFYESTALGAVTFTEMAGISRGAGVALVTAVALAGFAVASRLERPRR